MKESRKQIFDDKEYKVHVFWGTELASAVEEGDFEEAIRALNNEVVEHTERVFYTKEERDAYLQGIKDADGWEKHYVYPVSYGEPLWIPKEGSRVRFIMLAQMPSYIIPVVCGVITPEEYVDYYGPEGQEDIDNYAKWAREELEPLLHSNEHEISFTYLENGAENPDSYFTHFPIFGKACDVIPMLIFAFHD
ncbi:MAG: hypothetical protein PUB73_06185 [Bacteroidales bacterium]|nr:hypothetical protein [Bacteroidales bacterium]